MKAAVFTALATLVALSGVASPLLAPQAFPVAERSVAAGVPPLPERLSATGLFEPGSTRVRASHIAFTPQYPLWTDGMHKRRWLALPAGGFIDASNPDAWVFPVGTRLFKEFGTAEPPVETRMIERLANGSWRFASYVWNDAGTDATLAPEDGAVVAARGLPRNTHNVPARADCLACHDAGAGPVLGLTALQLSPARETSDGDAREDLRTLVARGVLRGLPKQLLDAPPRIAGATPTARAALDYLHGNCGHCHNNAGPLASLDLSLAQQASATERSAQRTLVSLLGHTSRFRPRGGVATARVVPGAQQASVLALRMQSASPFTRMPPLGAQGVDGDGVALIGQWIEHDLKPLPSLPR
jgi:hypothetical protein